MTLDDWIKYFNGDIDAVNAVHYLQKAKPFTDEEIIDAIDKIEKVASQCGLNRTDIIKMIFYSETTSLKI